MLSAPSDVRFRRKWERAEIRKLDASGIRWEERKRVRGEKRRGGKSKRGEDDHLD
jgi:hypothetical protein